MARHSTTADERHQRDLRLDEIEVGMQIELNEPYLNSDTRAKKLLRFNIGSPVVAVDNIKGSSGLFYSATVRAYDGLGVPGSLYPGGGDIPFELRVPYLFIHYDGWPDKNDITVPENELFTTMFPCRPVDTLALLFAHECNLVKRDQMNIPDGGLGVGAFLMDDLMYCTLEKSWQKDSGETMSFGQYCGREPGPFYSSTPLCLYKGQQSAAIFRKKGRQVSQGAK